MAIELKNVVDPFSFFLKVICKGRYYPRTVAGMGTYE